MAGYVIHLAVAEQYLKKHQNKKENYDEFIEGVIFPDSVENKEKTHYGKKSSYSNLYKFLQEHKIDNSFERGCFLHLLTDYLFYNKYIDTFSNDLYNDYDLLNESLIKKYDVKIPKKVQKYVFFKEGEDFKILNRNIAETLIEEISNLDIDSVAEEVKENPDKWTKIRELKYI